jgi:hypothetical protein
MGASVIIPSLFPFDLLKFVGHKIQFSIDFSVIPDILFQISLGIRDSFFDLIEFAHHSIEVIVDEVLLSVDLSLDKVGIWVYDHLQRLNVAIELGDLVFLVAGSFHEIGENASEGDLYVLLRLFLRVSY